jgi:hypothetical protein
VVSIGGHQGQLRIGFSRIDQAITPTGFAVGRRDAIWSMPSCGKIAPSVNQLAWMNTASPS